MLRRLARAILWPLRRFFDPRFQGIAEAINQDVTATVEATTLIGRTLGDLEALGQETHRLATEAQGLLTETHELAARASGVYFERLVGGNLNDLDQSVAHLLNYAQSHRGFAAQRNLWFNPPISLAYEPGGVKLVEVNERLAEIPHAYRALGRLTPEASVLDVGATESTLALSLAVLGYDVTAIDIRPYPLTHPHLKTVVGAIEDWDAVGEFDAVLCLSTIEHIGLRAYGAEPKDGADVAAVRRMRELTKPGGTLVLTTRFGKAREDEFQRTYDRRQLDVLLEGWSVDEMAVVRREDATTWVLADDNVGGTAEAVVLVTATRLD